MDTAFGTPPLAEDRPTVPRRDPGLPAAPGDRPRDARDHLGCGPIAPPAACPLHRRASLRVRRAVVGLMLR